ncbi:MAG: hypothetical protein ACKN81_15770, partial [Pirellulaceae bacterium]
YLWPSWPKDLASWWKEWNHPAKVEDSQQQEPQASDGTTPAPSRGRRRSIRCVGVLLLAVLHLRRVVPFLPPTGQIYRPGGPQIATCSQQRQQHNHRNAKARIVDEGGKKT